MSTEPQNEVLSEIVTRPPIKPILIVKNYNSKPYKFYQWAKPMLLEWWNEFKATLDDSTAGYKYPSVKSFIVEKVKGKEEQSWLMLMIGPEPELEPDEAPKVPWLGDWYDIRLNGTWLSGTNVEKLKSIATSQSTNSIESILSLRGVMLPIIGRLLREHDQIDIAFANQMLDPRFAPYSPENLKRYETYCKMQDDVRAKIYEAMHQMMTLNGFNPNAKKDEPANVFQINTQVNAGNPEQPTELPTRQLELLKLAQQLQYHSEKMKLPLPETLKPNGKAKVEIKGEQVKEKLQ